MAKNCESGVAIADTHEYLRRSPFYQETNLLPLLPWMVFSEGLTESEKRKVNLAEWWLPGTEFAWKDVPDESINKLKKKIQAHLNEACDFLADKNLKGAWDRLLIYYSMSDAVRLDRFLRDFDLWSSLCCRPVDERGRTLENLGFSKEALSDRNMNIQRRRGILVTALRSANRYSMILYGRRFFEDVSFGETEFRRVFLDISILFSWLVNESGIDKAWIPYPIMEFVMQHPAKDNVKSGIQSTNLLSSNFTNVARVKIKSLAKAMGWGEGESVTAKLNRYIKRNPTFAVSDNTEKGYYFLNLDHPEAPLFPKYNPIKRK